MGVIFRLLLVCFCFSGIFAQAPVRIIEGREFVVHTVKPKETLYGISRQYQVPVDTLLHYNPGAAMVVQIDQEILVPRPPKARVNVRNGVGEDSRYENYKVKPGETLYNLSKRFDTDERTLRDLNPQMGEYLREGEVIRVPRRKESSPVVPVVPANSNGSREAATSEEDELEETVLTESARLNVVSRCDTSGTVRTQMKIALLLPFQAGSGPNFKAAAAYLGGFKVASDSLARKGLSITLSVFDVSGRDDVYAMERIVNSGKLEGSNLIIGPFFPDALTVLLAYTRPRNIPVASPFSKRPDLLSRFPGVMRMSPGLAMRCTRTLGYFREKFPECAFFLASPGRSRNDSLQYAAYKQAFNELGIKYSPVTGGALHSQLQVGKKNVVIMPNSHEITIKNLMTNLMQQTRLPDISLVGMESWLDYQFISVHYFAQLDVYLPVVNQFNPFCEENKWFRAHYREEYKSEPELYAHRGLQHAWYFIRKLMHTGVAYPECNFQSRSGTCGGDIAFQGNRELGWENTRVELLRFQEGFYVLYSF
jgi:LysM repeat protein